MKTTRTILPVLLGLAATSAVAERDAAAAGALLYGHVYTLQNAANNMQGGYLDTRSSGCQGNDLCVSTATSPNRDSGSGAWMILPTNGRSTGTPVLIGDRVNLMNLWRGFGGYLDTDGGGCQSDDLCVSTATSPNRDSGSGTWEIVFGGFLPPPFLVPQWPALPTLEGQQLQLVNTWGDFNGGSLDTDGTGCQGNLLCVGTQRVQYPTGVSTGWIFQEITNPSFTPNADTYVALDGSGPWGGAADILVKTSASGAGSAVKKGLLEFPVPSAFPANGATLSLAVSVFDDKNGAKSAEFHLWGLAVGGDCDPQFSEATAVYGSSAKLLFSFRDMISQAESMTRPRDILGACIEYPRFFRSPRCLQPHALR